MRRQRMFLMAAVVLLVVMAASAAAAANGPDISWWLIGGGPVVTTGQVALAGGVGQGIAGETASGSTDLCSGFRCAPGGVPWHPPVYLPLALK